MQSQVWKELLIYLGFFLIGCLFFYALFYLQPHKSPGVLATLKLFAISGYVFAGAASAWVLLSAVRPSGSIFVATLNGWFVLSLIKAMICILVGPVCLPMRFVYLGYALVKSR